MFGNAQLRKNFCIRDTPSHSRSHDQDDETISVRLLYLFVLA
jgi:hypothetical protein